MAESKIVVKGIDTLTGEPTHKVVSYINRGVHDSVCAVFGRALNSLTTNTYDTTERWNILDAEREAGVSFGVVDGQTTVTVAGETIYETVTVAGETIYETVTVAGDNVTVTVEGPTVYDTVTVAADVFLDEVSIDNRFPVIFNAQNQYPELLNYNSGVFSLGAAASAAGSQTLQVEPIVGKWSSDSTSSVRSLEWNIETATVAVPEVTDSVAIGDSATPSVGAYDSTFISISSNVPTVTGSSTLTANLIYPDYTVWNDATTEIKYLPWFSVHEPYGLSSITPAEIKDLIQAGAAPKIWNVGDVTAPFELAGTLTAGDAADADKLVLDNVSVRARIVGINHNCSVESGGDPNVQFVLEPADIANGCFAVPNSWTSYPDPTYAVKHFTLFDRHTVKTYNYSQSKYHTRYLPQLYNCLPAAWRNVIANCTKTFWDGSAVVNAEMQMFIASEFEIYGAITDGAAEEADSQMQYDYYKTAANQLIYKEGGELGAAYLRTRESTTSELWAVMGWDDEVSPIVPFISYLAPVFAADLLPFFMIS